MYKENLKEIKLEDVKELTKFIRQTYVTEKKHAVLKISPQWGKGFLVRVQTTHQIYKPTGTATS